MNRLDKPQYRRHAKSLQLALTNGFVDYLDVCKIAVSQIFSIMLQCKQNRGQVLDKTMRKGKKNQSKTPEITEITGLSHDGKGIAKIHGKTTFIRGALPGEKVSFLYRSKKSQFDEGMIETVITASDDRVTPPCDFYGLCGGCDLQHLDPKKQIEYKQAILLEQIEQMTKTKPTTLLPPLTAKTLGYRRKARLGVRYVNKKERVLVGFRELNGRYQADMNRCETLHPKIGHNIAAFSELITRLDAYQTIAQIEVAVGDDAAALVFRHLEDLSENDLAKLIAFGAEQDFHIYLQPKGPDSVHRIYPNKGLERLQYQLDQQNLRFAFHPIDFVQINREINQAMVSQAITLLDVNQNDIVLDLFCGLGNFSLPLAQKAKHVVALEGDQQMVERGTANAAYNTLTNIEFHLDNLFEPNLNQPWMKHAFTKVLLDPPRAGAAEIIPFLIRLKPKKILYISCNPATLARDSKWLVDGGFTVEAAGVMDMFPQTHHIEAIAVFSHTAN